MGNSGKLFKKIAAFILVFSLISNYFIQVRVKASNKEEKILIATTTDMHGKFSGWTNSYLNVSSWVKDFRKEYKSNLLLIDNGDAFQGTRESHTNLFQGQFGNLLGDKDKGNPDANPIAYSLKEIGYDVFVLGNHEFDYPRGIMQNIYDYLEKNGVSVGCANIYEENTSKRPFSKHITKVYNVFGKAFKVAVFCITKNLKSKYEGLAFDDEPVYKIVDKNIKKLDNGKKIITNETGGEPEVVDYTVVSYHYASDKVSASDPQTKQKEEADENSITNMVKNNDAIDLVVAGHDHVASIKKTPNKNGKDITVINAGPKNIGTVELSLKENNGNIEVESTECKNNSLNDSRKWDRDLFKSGPIQSALKYSREVCDAKLGEIEGKDWDTDSLKEYLKYPNSMNIIKHKLKSQNNDTTSLLSKATIWSAQKHMANKQGNWVAACSPGFGFAESGVFKVKDCYKLCHYDNWSYVVGISGSQLRSWLETIAGFCKAENGKALWTDEYPYCYSIVTFYGVNYRINASKEVGDRVENLVLSSTGEKVTDDTKIYLVLDNYQFNNIAFKKSVGDSIKVLWNSKESLGPIDGLIKFQLGCYVKDKVRIKHDDTNHNWKLCA